MTREPKQRLMNSKAALQILQILSKGEQKYVRQLAEELERPQDSIHTYVKLLRKENLIERGKRTQAQYYRINYEGITKFITDLLKERLEEVESATDDSGWVESALMTIEDEKNSEILDFVERYIEVRIDDAQDSTIEEFLFKNMYADLNHTFMLNTDLTKPKNYATWLRTALSVYIGEGKGQDISNIL